jgi:hypothetical protein
MKFQGLPLKGEADVDVATPKKPARQVGLTLTIPTIIPIRDSADPVRIRLFTARRLTLSVHRKGPNDAAASLSGSINFLCRWPRFSGFFTCKAALLFNPRNRLSHTFL